MIGRIELRTTFDGFWAAIYRLPGAADAYEIARIRYTLVEKNETNRDAFKKLVIQVLGSLITEAGAKNVVWHEEEAGG